MQNNSLNLQALFLFVLKRCVLIVFGICLQVVLTLDCYGVTNIRGIRCGYRGFFEENLCDIPVCSNTLAKCFVETEIISLKLTNLCGLSRLGHLLSYMCKLVLK